MTTAAAAGAVEARHLVIHGRVQGVGFRYSMAHEARRLSLAGWVRNRHDGTVEAVVVGTAPQVAAMLVWARRGPSAARVDQVEVELAPAAEATGLLAARLFEQRVDA